MCFEKRLDKCWADFKKLNKSLEKIDYEAPLNKFSYSKINTPQNIDFDGELNVEENAI